MSDQEEFSRRGLLRSATAAGVAASVVPPALSPAPAAAQATQAAAASSANGAPASMGYSFLRPEEASFVEALADHMVPADRLTPSGTDVGIPVFIDRALGGSYGKGDRLYMNGPWLPGTANQGYQVPFTPAELCRAGIEQTNAYCRKTYGKSFDALAVAQKEEVLKALDEGKLAFESGLNARQFWAEMYQMVIQGLFADPIYGGNRNKVGWKMVGFPGVIQVNQQKIREFRNKKYAADPISISDVG